jgi:hypothetical protein
MPKLTFQLNELGNQRIISLNSMNPYFLPTHQHTNICCMFARHCQLMLYLVG